jgi:membrane carboxypeptidase/penicillin-binding protein PbpC
MIALQADGLGVGERNYVDKTSSYAATHKPLMYAVAVSLRQSSNTSMLQQMPTDFGDRTSTEKN